MILITCLSNYLKATAEGLLLCIVNSLNLELPRNKDLLLKLTKLFGFVYFKLVEEIVVIASTWFTPIREPKEHGDKPSETTKQTVEDIWALLESTNQFFVCGANRVKSSPPSFQERSNNEPPRENE